MPSVCAGTPDCIPRTRPLLPLGGRADVCGASSDDVVSSSRVVAVGAAGLNARPRYSASRTTGRAGAVRAPTSRKPARLGGEAGTVVPDPLPPAGGRIATLPHDRDEIVPSR